jgi:hypothetical protein
MGSFSLVGGAFDIDVIDLSIIVSMLPLVIKISIGASGDCENYVMDWKIVGLLQEAHRFGAEVVGVGWSLVCVGRH